MLITTLAVDELDARLTDWPSVFIAGRPPQHRRHYLVPVPALTDLIDALPGGSGVQRLAGRVRLGHDVTYLDTPDHDAFHREAHRRTPRLQARLLCYSDWGHCWLELETIDAHGRTSERRQPLEWPDDPGALSGASPYLASRQAAWVDRWLAHHHLPVIATRLRPALNLTYSGTGFELADGTAFTVDTNLQWRTPEGDTANLDGLALVTTRTAAADNPAEESLRRAGLRPVRFSGYATGLALLRPDLVAPHQWRRALALMASSGR